MITAQQIIEATTEEYCRQGLEKLGQEVEQIMGAFSPFEADAIKDSFYQTACRIDGYKWH